VDGVFTAIIALGAGIYLIILIAAPLLAGLYDEPELAGLLIVQGTTCLFTGVRSVPEALNVIALIHVTVGSFVLRNAGFEAMLWVWMSFGVVFVVCSLRMIQKAIGTLG
jgi:hypothetical protein